MIPCTTDILPESLRAALEQRNEEEEKQLKSGVLVPAFSKKLMVRPPSNSSLGKEKISSDLILCC